MTKMSAQALHFTKVYTKVEQNKYEQNIFHYKEEERCFLPSSF